MKPAGRRCPALLGLLALAGVLYAGLVGAHRFLLERDYSEIQDIAARMGYCIAASLSSGEKSTLAESLARPSDAALFGKLTPRLITGEVTKAKLLAGRALRERDDLHARSSEILARRGRQCGDEHRPATAGALRDLAFAWLRHDKVFVGMLEYSRSRLPDAAARYGEKGAFLD